MITQPTLMTGKDLMCSQYIYIFGGTETHDHIYMHTNYQVLWVIRTVYNERN